MSDSPTPMVATGRTRDLVIAIDRALLRFARHWLAVFNLVVALYVGLPFLAPALMVTDHPRAARMIYSAYKPFCHQFAFRSWFLFGERLTYPRDVFTKYTGIDSEDLWAARAYVGDERVGYKVAFCERDVAIYGGVLILGLLYGATGKRLPAIGWLPWLLIGILPIAIDGFSQLFSQPPYNLWAYRESTALLRTVTGFLFGAMNVWLAYPYVKESMALTESELAAKLARVDGKSGS